MANNESPGESKNYKRLLERIHTARTLLHTALEADARCAVLDELGVATQGFTELILKHKGKLKSPLEPEIDRRKTRQAEAEAGSGE